MFINQLKMSSHILVLNLKKMRKLYILLLVMLSMVGGFLNAQITITTPYPVAAQPITRGLDTSLLTVEVQFTAACANTTTTITLPSSVSYVPGSVAAIPGSTTAGFSIAESNISNLGAPVFSIVAPSIGSIRFTIKRFAGCGAAANGKDVVSVTGACGTAVENNVNINTYNLLAPALTLTPPAAIANAVVGQTATRTTSISNGGTGCTDTVRFYVVYPAGGIVNTNTNQITVGGTNFSPWRTNGDTLFYKIFGATLFGGNNLLCNGESITISEPIRIVKCNTTTAYAAYWSKAEWPGCQTSSGTSAVTMATGVPNLSTTVTDVVPTSPCSPGTVRITYTNTGSGGTAGAMYNVRANFGNVNPNAPQTIFSQTNPGNGTFAIGYSNFQLGGTTAVTATAAGATLPWVMDAAQFASDPDGAGTGLEDLDGDGQFDDLAPGQSFSITMTRTYNQSPLCTRPSYYLQTGGVVLFNNMCGTAVTPLVTGGTSIWQNTGAVVTPTLPTLVAGGQPFTIRICNIGYLSTTVSQLPTDSLYLKIDLPAGVSYVPSTGQFNGVAGVVSQVGNSLYISGRKNGISNFCFQADFVYTCGSSGTLNFPYEMYWVLERSCNAIEYLRCGTTSLEAKCPAPCVYIGNYAPTARRVNYGWKDATRTTLADSATLPLLAKKTALPYDTLNIIQPAKQGTNAANSLYYYYQIGRAGGQDVVSFLGGTVNFKAGGTGPTVTCPLPAITTIANTSTLTRWTWNLTPLMTGACLPTTINPGDSIWVDYKLAVTTANFSALYSTTLTAPPSQLSYLYNFDNSPVQDYCDAWAPDIYLLGISRGVTSSYKPTSPNASGCNNVNVLMHNAGAVMNESGDAFPFEYRPYFILDSVKYVFPPGLDWAGVGSTIIVDTFSAPFTVQERSLDATNVTYINKVLTIKNPGTWWFDDLLPSTFAQRHRTTVVARGNCAATASNPFTVQTFGKAYAYANINEPTISSYTSTGSDGLSVTYNPANKPSLTVTNQTGVVQGVSTQQYWDVQISNPSTQTAPYLWLALERGTGSGAITIDSVVAKPSNVVLTSEGSYTGSGITGYSWYKASVAGINSGVSNNYRVYFKYSSCNPDSILLKAGWSCTEYPNANPSVYPCTAAQSYLKVEPQPSQVQLAMVRQPGGGATTAMCATDYTEFLINSAQAANLVNPYVRIYTPTGVNISTPIEVTYPNGVGGVVYSLTPVAITGGYQINLNDIPAIASAGLPGTSLNPTVPGRQALVRVNYTTTCDITSGTSFDFYAYGNRPCGSVATDNGTNIQTGGVSITGATVTGTMGITMGAPNYTLNCGSTTTLSLSSVALGAATQAGDVVEYTLPVGMTYVSGSFVGGANCSTCTVSTTVNGAGNTIVSIALTPGVPANTTIDYSFNVSASAGGCSAPTPIRAAAKRNITGLMCGATACTGSSVVFGTQASANFILNKPNLTISTGFVSGGWLPGTSKTVSLTIANTGTLAAAANGYTVEFYCGSSTTPFSSNVVTQAIPINGTITENITIAIPSSPTCNLGQAITARINPNISGGGTQCLCNSTSYQFLTILPVELESFTASERDCNVQLNWLSATEVNFAKYVVEYSNNGSEYKTVGELAAQGNGSRYSWKHLPVPGRSYYRLKMVDTDGREKFSKVIVLNAVCTGKAVLVFPNPASSILNVNLSGYTGRITGRMINHAGQVVYTGQLVNGSNTISTALLPSATYMLIITDENGESKSNKVQVVH